jgi:hypothetical protein
MNVFWITSIGVSASCFAFKYLGQSVPESWLNLFIPVALLSALVAVQGFTEKTKLVIDHRAAGVAFALAAFAAKLPFPVAVFGAAATSAIIYRVI